MYLQRMTALAGRAFAWCMNGLDERLSTACIFIAAFALLHALQQCMSGSGLFPQACNPYAGRACGTTGLQAQAARRPSRLAHRHSDGLRINPSSPCPLTLICSSFTTSRLGRCFLQRPFLFPGYFRGGASCFLDNSSTIQNILKRYPEIGPVNVLGHSDIAAGARGYPGPMFARHALYLKGIGAWFEPSSCIFARRNMTVL